LAAADALLVPMSGHPTFADFIPSKLIDFLATGRPVVASAAGETAALLNQKGAGIVVPPEDSGALATALRELAADPERGRSLAKRGQEIARSRLREVQAARLEDVLLATVGRRR